MKMTDMGMTDKERYGETIGMDASKMKDKKHYESIMMMSDKMPSDMGEMHAGETHKMCIEVMVKRVEKDENGKTQYKLELRKIGKIPEMKKEINPYQKSE